MTICASSSIFDLRRRARVGAAVLVLIAVDRLRLVRALVDAVGDAVLVVVGIGAAVLVLEAVHVLRLRSGTGRTRRGCRRCRCRDRGSRRRPRSRPCPRDRSGTCRCCRGCRRRRCRSSTPGSRRSASDALWSSGSFGQASCRSSMPSLSLSGSGQPSSSWNSSKSSGWFGHLSSASGMVSPSLSRSGQPSSSLKPSLVLRLIGTLVGLIGDAVVIAVEEVRRPDGAEEDARLRASRGRLMMPVPTPALSRQAVDDPDLGRDVDLERVVVDVGNGVGRAAIDDRSRVDGVGVAVHFGDEREPLGHGVDGDGAAVGELLPDDRREELRDVRAPEEADEQADAPERAPPSRRAGAARRRSR